MLVLPRVMSPVLRAHLGLGSNVIVAGTAIFGAENPDQVIAGLKSTVNTAQELAQHSQ